MGRVLYHLLSRRRKVAIDNILRSGIVADVPRAQQLAQAHFEHIATNAVEACLIDWVQDHKLGASLISTRNEERVAEALAPGRGVIMAIGHLGNWELSSIGFCRQLQTLHSVYRPLDYAPMDRLVLRARTRAGMKMIPTTRAIRSIVEILRGNGAVALLTDQDARAGGIFVDFFGRPASTLSTPAVLSMRYGAPIVPVNVFRQAGRHVIAFDPPVFPEVFAKEKDPIKAITQKLVSRLEAFIREHPAQWFWVHRRWKTQPA